MQNSEKIDPALLLSLSLSKEDRQRNEEFETGYQSDEESWELIVKYQGNSLDLGATVGRFEPLLAGYGIVTMPQSQIELLVANPQIEYIEKPKRLYPQEEVADRVSCFTPFFYETSGLSGEGVYLAILDSGIAYENEVFRKANGETKLAYLWDQTQVGTPPVDFQVGREYNSKEINENLQHRQEEGENEQTLTPLLSVDITGHGTKVSSIAMAKAPNCQLIVVKLDTQKQRSFPSTTSVMRGLTYVVKKALQDSQPLVVNLSFGNTYGPHNGSTLLERYIDEVMQMGKSCICIGSGNEGATGGHFEGTMQESVVDTVELAIGNYERTLSLQLWKDFADGVELSLRSPAGQVISLDNRLLEEGGTEEKSVFEIDGCKVTYFYAPPTPYRKLEENYIVFEASQQYLPTGIWRIVLRPLRLRNGYYQMYLPSAVVRSSQTKFLKPSANGTLTIPSTSERAITVGAIDPEGSAYADFSGRGFLANKGNSTFFTGVGKPDVVAPGVNILAQGINGLERVTGTSYATPLVAAACGLFMEWGIVKGNDPYLYGEKIKAYLQRGAKELAGYDSWPNEKLGYGCLCVADSLPHFGG